MNKKQIIDIIKEYNLVSIQTRQVTLNDLNMNKIDFISDNLMKCTIRHNEDVFINTKDVKAIYGKGRK